MEKSEWTCSICGKVNNEMVHNCIACGRQKGMNVDSRWACLICGTVHHDNDGKIHVDCRTCGRKKGYVGCKASKTLNIVPSVTKNELDMIEPKTDARYVANESMFLSSKYDYEVNARMGVIDEVKCVLASINHTLQNN